MSALAADVGRARAAFLLACTNWSTAGHPRYAVGLLAQLAQGLELAQLRLAAEQLGWPQ